MLRVRHGKSVKLLRPFQVHTSPATPHVHQPGSSLNLILLGFYASFSSPSSIRLIILSIPTHAGSTLNSQHFKPSPLLPTPS